MTSPKQEGAFKRLVRSLSRSSPRSERPQPQQRSSSRGKRLDDIAKYAPANNGVAIPNALPSPQGVSYSTSPPPGELGDAFALPCFATPHLSSPACQRSCRRDDGTCVDRRTSAWPGRRTVSRPVAGVSFLAGRDSAGFAFAADLTFPGRAKLTLFPSLSADSYFPRPPSEVLNDSEANGRERHPDSIGARYVA